MAETLRDVLMRRFIRSETALDDEELLTLLLSSVASPKRSALAAKSLIERFPNLYALLRAPKEDWESASGVSAEMVTLLSMIRQLERRSVSPEMAHSGLNLTVRDLGEFIRPYFRHTNVEEAYLLCLDASLHTLGCYQINAGSADSVMLTPASVVQIALRVGAAACVLAHNHPAAVAEFSAADQYVTEKIFFALDAVGVLLLDHVVLAADELISMERQGFFQHLFEKKERGLAPSAGRPQARKGLTVQNDAPIPPGEEMPATKRKPRKEMWEFFE